VVEVPFPINVVLFVVGQLLADLTVAWLDPRVRANL
jgi:ABC-type dipeptide/oligopeptide/nickel transport system permease component